MRTQLHKTGRTLLALLVLTLSLLTSFYLVRADSVWHPKATSLSLERQNALRDYIIYEDSLAPGWKNCSWGSKINFANTSPRYSGERSISFAATRSRSALCLYTETALPTTSYSYLRFAAQASRGGQEYRVGLFERSNHRGADVQPATFNINPPAGTWKMYTIPLLDLSAHPTKVRGIVIQSRAAFPQPALYIDTVGITDVVSPLPTPTPSPTSTFSPTPTLSPTRALSPTPTLSPTPSPTPTHTPTPTPNPTPPSTGGNGQGMSIAAYYGPLGKWWDMMASSFPATRMVVVENTSSNGPGSSLNPTLLSEINQMRQAGIRAFGYVYTSFGNRSPAAVKADVDQWKALYSVTDIMFDEAWAGTSKIPFYSDIASYVHRTPGALVELNPGAPIDEAYMQFTDILSIYEGSYSQYLNFHPPSWVTKYPATRFKNYIWGVPGSSVIPGLLQKVIQNHTGYFDITDSTNPWWELASDAFWNALVPAVKAAF
jgi:hypothetical protein